MSEIFAIEIRHFSVNWKEAVPKWKSVTNWKPFHPIFLSTERRIQTMKKVRNNDSLGNGKKICGSQLIDFRKYQIHDWNFLAIPSRKKIYYRLRVRIISDFLNPWWDDEDNTWASIQSNLYRRLTRTDLTCTTLSVPYIGKICLTN